MFGSRPPWTSLLIAGALALMLPGCATTTPETPGSRTAAAQQCYWLSNEGAGWVARPDLTDAETCFEMDSCSGGGGMSGGGCYKWTVGADGAQTAWAALGLTAQTQRSGADAGASCYINSDKDGRGWVPMEGLREAQCFARDTCNGGLGDEQGLCLKWARDASAPALPWSTTLTQPRLKADVPPPDEIYAGSYEATSDCPEQGCAYGPARFSAATPLYSAQDLRSRVIATVPPTECALKTGVDALLSAPMRGVVLETGGRFEAGDVIYLTNYEGEGFSTVWRRGEYLGQFQDDEAIVRWDRPQKPDPREGYWVEVRRANGQKGWAKDPDIAERDCAFPGR